jgi:hypothetical protein
MPRSYRSPAARGLECLSHLIYTVRPCMIHTVHAAPMPCSTVLFFWRSRLLRGVPRRLLSAAYQSQCETKHRLSWTRKRVLAAHYKKDDLLNCWTSSSDISGHHVDLTRRTRHCRSRAGARHGMCELTYGMAGEGHGRGMLCVNRPLTSWNPLGHCRPVTGLLYLYVQCNLDK